MRHFVLPFFVALWLTSVPSPAEAQCCGGKRAPLIREELRDSDVVWVVRVEFANQDPKSEERDLTIVEAFKDHPVLANKHVVRYAGAIPIPDPKKPPTYLVVGNLLKGGVDIYRGYEATPEVLAYATGLLRFHPMDHRQTLRFCSGFLDSACKEVQEDAYTEFLESDVADVKAIAKKLPVVKLRALVQNQKLPSDFRNLSGYLLGLCGEEKDAGLLRRLLENKQGKEFNADDRLLKGYVLLRPKEGWEFVVEKVTNKTNDFLDRYRCLLAARYFYSEHPGMVAKKEILQLLDTFLDQEDMADFAIDDLRKWKRWEFMSRVLALWGKKGYDIPICQRSILRFALQSPKPSAQRFVAQRRAQDPEWVEETEKWLGLEKRLQ